MISIISVELSTTQGMKVKAAQAGNIVKNVEWVLAYAKDINSLMDVKRTPLYDYRIHYPNDYYHILVDGEIQNLIKYYNSTHQNNKIVSLENAYATNKDFREFVHNNADRIYAYACAKGFDKPEYRDGHIHRVRKNNKNYIVQLKGNTVRQLLPLSASIGNCDDIENNVGIRKIRGDLWKDFYRDMCGVSKEGAIGFNNGKKPVRLIEQLCKWAVGSKKDAVILDFFAGSGTTAQSVEQLNQRDGGRRKWILVTNNEDQENDDDNPETGICRDVTKPRIDTVITGIRPDGKPYGAGGIDSGYKYFQYKFIPRIRRQYERNSYRFFQPYIVDAATMLKYGVQRVAQDEREMLCVYSSDVVNIISFYADSTLEQVDMAIQRHVDDSDERKLLLLLPEDSSHFSEIRAKYVGSSVEVNYQHVLLRTADYLE